jgi:HK97 family phage prohead protease
MDLLQKAFTFEIKAADDEARTFSGRASTWDLDLDGERIRPGAFKKSLNDWRSGDKPIPLIDQHNYSSVMNTLGKMVDAEETEGGLEAKFEVVDTPSGNELWSRIKMGVVNGLSIGFKNVRDPDIVEEEADGKKRKVRVLKEIKLMEVSAVIWGANPNALIDATTAKTLLHTQPDALTPRPAVDVESLEATADAPEEKPTELQGLEKELADIVAMKEAAVAEEDYDTAALLRDQQRGLEARLARKQKEQARTRRAVPLGAPDDPGRLKAEAILAGLRAREAEQAIAS